MNPAVLLSPVRLGHEDPLFFELLDWTRVHPAARLGAALGARHLTLLDETRLPSGSLKDRATLAVLMRAREIGAATIACASTGNAGASLACLAARLGMEAVVFAPAAAPPAKLRQVQAHGARLLLVDGNYDLAYELCLAAVAERGWVSRNTAHNPWCAEGKKSAVLALARPGVRTIADAILVPAGDGCILAGVRKGLVDLQRVGWIDTLPRLVAVQPEGSAAIAEAWRAGRGIEPVAAHSVADSLVVDRPRDGEKALRALRETKGFALTVSDAEILAAGYELRAWRASSPSRRRDRAGRPTRRPSPSGCWSRRGDRRPGHGPSPRGPARARRSSRRRPCRFRSWTRFPRRTKR